MIYSWQVVNVGNLAEHISRPTDYFSDFKAEVLDWQCEYEELLKGPVIFGATGLLFPGLDARLKYASENSKHPLIAWGIGHNTHFGDRIEYPEWLSKFSAVGVRDWGTPYCYVPCPSCMNSVIGAAVERDASPTVPMVIYEHMDFPVRIEADLPRMNNQHEVQELGKVVDFLASAKVIVTSSYHGAYWGFLLNRRVLVWEPWSTKFWTFKPKTLFVDKENWRLASTVPQDNTGYYEDCITRNRQFAAKVRAILGV